MTARDYLAIAAAAVARAEEDREPLSDWPSLIPLDAPLLPTLERDVLPGWLGDYVAALADATETPLELAASQSLAAVSTAVARRYRVLVQPGYTEPTNLWLACALAPGNRKSAVQSAAMAPLQAWERDESVRLGPEIELAKSDVKTAEARAKDMRTRAAKAERAEAEALAREVAEIEATMPSILIVPQLWTSDVTPEQLGALLADQGERMAWLSSEGGIFDLLAGRYSSGIPNLDLVLKSHSGDADRVDRRSRSPVFLRNPLLTIGLSPQPDVLRGLASKPGFRGRGLLGRFFWFLPQSTLGYRTLAAAPVSDAIGQAYHDGIRRILNTPLMLNDDEQECPHLLHLSPEAEVEWLDFARHIEAQMRPGGRFEHAQDWAGKAPGAGARLAGVFHVVETGGTEPEISKDTITRALNLVSLASHHALAAFDLMGADEAVDGARTVLRWVVSGHRASFTVRDGFNALRARFPQVKKIEPAFAVLEERGYVKVEKGADEERSRGRPRSPTVTVRPEIVESWR
jgi:hypothetical protein